MPQPAPVFGLPSDFDISDLPVNVIKPASPVIDNAVLADTITDLATGDVVETWDMVLINSHNGAVVVTLSDKGEAPVDLVPGVAVPANSVYSLAGKLRWSGGISGFASVDNVITIQSSGRIY